MNRRSHLTSRFPRTGSSVDAAASRHADRTAIILAAGLLVLVSLGSAPRVDHATASDPVTRSDEAPSYGSPRPAPQEQATSPAAPEPEWARATQQVSPALTPRRLTSGRSQIGDRDDASRAPWLIRAPPSL